MDRMQNKMQDLTIIKSHNWRLPWYYVITHHWSAIDKPWPTIVGQVGPTLRSRQRNFCIFDQFTDNYANN